MAAPGQELSRTTMFLHHVTKSLRLALSTHQEGRLGKEAVTPAGPRQAEQEQGGFLREHGEF